MAETVFVTGASGFIAKHIIVKLLRAGYTVVGSLRSLDRSEEVRATIAKHTEGDLGRRLSFAALDLARDEGWSEALAGSDVLMHTASPFPLTQPKDEDAVVRPAVEGTRRALRAAQAAGITRVIMTSSSLSIVNSDLPPGQTLYTEENWSDVNHPASTPYATSKTLAERAAWDFVETEAPEIDLTVINPVFVLGTPLDGRYGTSIKVVERLLKAADPALPQFGFPTVDVEDVAEVHLRALTTPGTEGKRYIASDRFIWFYEMAEILKAAHPDRKIVTRRAPNLLVRFLSLFDVSIRTVVPILGQKHEISNARATEELGMTFRPIEESVRATAAFLIAQKIV